MGQAKIMRDFAEHLIIFSQYNESNRFNNNLAKIS